MEALGGAASIITIWEFAHKLISLGNIFKDAPEAWKRYTAGLHGVACTQQVLRNTLNSYPQLRNLTTEDNGKQSPLLDDLDRKLSSVKDDASNLLERYRLEISEKTPKRRRFLEWISKNRHAVKFSLNKELLSGLIQDVEHAQSLLHLALTLVSLHTFESWKSQATDLLNSINTEMRKHGDALEQLKQQGGRLRQAKVEVVVEKGLMPRSSLFSLEPLEKNQSSSKEPSIFSCTPVTKKMDSGRGLGGFWAASIKKLNSRQRKLRSTSVHTQHNKALEDSTYPGLDDLDDGNDDADNESSDDNELPHQVTGNNDACELYSSGSHGIEFGYIFEEETNRLFQVPVDSAEYKSATSPISNPDIEEDQPLNPSATIRADEFAELISDEEWEEAKYRPMTEIMELATSVCCTAYPTDAEMTKDQSWVTMVFQPYTYVFIAQTVRLALCRNKGSTKLNFCVDRISVASNGQVLCVTEPCYAQDGSKCKHVTIEVEDRPILAASLPRRIELTSISCIGSSEDELDDGSNWDGTIPLYPRCRRRVQCPHTLVDDGENNRARCSRRHKFSGSPAETQPFMEVSHASTECAPPEAEDYTVHGTGDCQDQQQSTVDPRFPVQSGPDDEEHAFNLLKHVMLDEALHIPPKVEWDVLVRFLFLAEKYHQSLGDKPLRQAKTWVSFFKPSWEFDKNALTWLWIMLKLRMETEFKKLSSVVQKQARNPIAHWQDGSDNKHHLKLPKLIISLLDQRRSAVLLRLRHAIVSAIESHRSNYLNAVAQEMDVFSVLDTMRFSLQFGYLLLESDRWLARQDAEGDRLEFCGVSYADVSSGISSMVDLGNWKLCAMSVADRMPVPLAKLSLLIPLVGVSLHQEGVHGLLETDFQTKLTELLTEIEEEDWGIDLAPIM